MHYLLIVLKIWLIILVKKPLFLFTFANLLQVNFVTLPFTGTLQVLIK